jgi:hypothetical protein
VVSSPSPGSGYNELYDVWVTSPGDVWAVGEYSDDLDAHGQAATGSDIPDIGSRTLLLHWNAESWNVVDSPNLGVGSGLSGVGGSWGVSDDATSRIMGNWAVGSYITSGGNTTRTLIEHMTAPPSPLSTWSIYEEDISPPTHYEQGSRAADVGESGIIFLDYGQPRDFGSTPTQHDFGARLIDSHYPAKIAEIETAVKWFMDGYHAKWRGWPQQVYVAVSINNDNQDGKAELSIEHAQAWADMVTRLMQYALNRGYDEISVVAGIDAEPSWEPTYNESETWVRSYVEYPNTFSALYNFGSIDNYPCVSFPPPHEPCSDWDVEQLYQINWGIRPALLLPVPQVYRPVRGRWWDIVAWKGFVNHDGDMMDFAGSAGGSIYLTAEQAWRLLWLELNSDPRTRQTPDWTTKFRWSSTPYP